MKKNGLVNQEHRRTCRIEDSLAAKFMLKRSSNPRRLQTEPHDPAQNKQKSSSKKLQFTTGTYRISNPSRSAKKTIPVSCFYQRKSTQLGNLPPAQLTSTLTRNVGSKHIRDFQDPVKTNVGTRGLLKRVDDYKKHLRVKTQVYEDRTSKRVSSVYKKLSNIQVSREREQSRELQKNYRIEEIVGKGTFGVVYRAKSLISKEIVAIKTVLQDKRYKNRELQILKMLHHPNLLEIKDYYFTRQGSQEFLNVVMDFYDENLYNFNRQKVRKGEFINPLLVKVYAYQMFKAINYLAALSIAHRDIKPHNILINPSNNKLVICDFGSAKELVPTQTNLAYICSRCYRAPELIFGATDYTSQIDMWSIGCVIVEMINGEPPFLGESQLDQLIQIIKVLGTPSKSTVLEMNSNYDMKDYKFPSTPARQWKKVLRPRTDPLLVDLVSRVMEYSPKKRITPFEAMCHEYFDDLRDATNYKQIVTKTGCKDLLKFNKEQTQTDKDFLQKLQPSWL